jgi:hypothetical protein
MSVSRCVERRLSGVLYASTEAARRWEQVQENLGQGPGPTALLLGSPVLVPDLPADPTASWTELRREAAVLGIGSVFAFPVQIGAVVLGLLTAHGGRPVRLQDSTIRSLVGLAHRLAGAFLPPVVDGHREAPESATDLLGTGRIVTHQAVGMVTVQLGCSLEDAMVALRARAYADGVNVAEVARDVVERRVTFAQNVGKSGRKDHDEGQEGRPGHG